MDESVDWSGELPPLCPILEQDQSFRSPEFQSR